MNSWKIVTSWRELKIQVQNMCSKKKKKKKFNENINLGQEKHAQKAENFYRGIS